jgi:hypothetical protein
MRGPGNLRTRGDPPSGTARRYACETVVRGPSINPLAVGGLSRPTACRLRSWQEQPAHPMPGSRRITKEMRILVESDSYRWGSPCHWPADLGRLPATRRGSWGYRSASLQCRLSRLSPHTTHHGHPRLLLLRAVHGVLERFPGSEPHRFRGCSPDLLAGLRITPCADRAPIGSLRASFTKTLTVRGHYLRN